MAVFLAFLTIYYYTILYKKAHRELCRVRDEQKTFGKIHVNTIV